MAKKRRKEHLFLGVLLLGLGIYFLLQPGDFLSFRGSPVSKLLFGGSSTFFGLFSLYLYAFRHPSSREQEFVKCINCGAPCNKKDVVGSICPKCGGSVEDMEGIFLRHPELAGKDKKKT
jgi:hypothetical protein